MENGQLVGTCPACDGRLAVTIIDGEISYECLDCGLWTSSLPENPDKEFARPFRVLRGGES